MLREEMQVKLVQLKQQASEIWPCISSRYQFKKAHLMFSPDIRGAWALAWLSSNTIEISMKRVTENPVRTVNEVVGHELCHIITPLLHPEIQDPHGKEWQEVMNKMGIDIDPIDLI